MVEVSRLETIKPAKRRDNGKKIGYTMMFERESI